MSDHDRRQILDRLEALEAEEPVCRDRVGEQTATEFEDAREAGDRQAQIDILYEILTGVEK